MALAAWSLVGAWVLMPPMPPETDAVLTLSWTPSVRQQLQTVWEAMGPVLGEDAEAERWGRDTENWLREVAAAVAQSTGARWDTGTVQVELGVDWDEVPPVVAARIAGARPQGLGAPEAGDEERAYEGVRVHFRPSLGVGWAVQGPMIVVGGVRGLQRLLRAPEAKKGPNGGLPLRSQVRLKNAELRVDVRVSPRLRRLWEGEWGLLGALLGEADHVSLAWAQEQGRMRWRARDRDAQNALVPAVRATLSVAGEALHRWRREGYVTQSAHEAQVIGVGSGGEDKKKALQAWTETVLGAVKLGFTASARAPSDVAVDVTLSPTTAFWALLMRGGLHVGSRWGTLPTVEVERWLLGLRRLQREYRGQTGAFLACGPQPREIPQRAVAWPSGTCFDRLGFRPPGRVRFQLEASVHRDNLVLVARSDGDGDGIPEVWYLDEQATAVRRVGGFR